MNPTHPRPSSASFPPSHSPPQPQQQPQPQSNKARTWKACQVCRKRKIKCDGKLPCDFCTLNEKDCSYAEALDNAAKSRAQSSTVSHRLDRLESLLTGLLPLAELVKTWAPPSGSSSSPSAPFRAGEVDGQGDELGDGSGKGGLGLAPGHHHHPPSSGSSAVPLPPTNPVRTNLPNRTPETHPSIRKTPLLQPNQHPQSTNPTSPRKQSSPQPATPFRSTPFPPHQAHPTHPEEGHWTSLPPPPSLSGSSRYTQVDRNGTVNPNLDVNRNGNVAGHTHPHIPPSKTPRTNHARPPTFPPGPNPAQSQPPNPTPNHPHGPTVTYPSHGPDLYPSSEYGVENEGYSYATGMEGGYGVGFPDHVAAPAPARFHAHAHAHAQGDPSNQTSRNPGQAFTPRSTFRPLGESTAERTGGVNGTTLSSTGMMGMTSTPANQANQANRGPQEGKPGRWEDRLSGRLALDNRGHLKFHGGPATFLLSDAFDALRNDREGDQTGGNVRSNLGAVRGRISGSDGQGAQGAGAGVEGESEEGEEGEGEGVDLDDLYFKPWAQFRELRGLPSVTQAKFPPRKICDFLVKTYFTQFHSTFPILDRATFLEKYIQIMDSKEIASSHTDNGFLSTIFAVFTAVARIVRNHMREQEGLDWSLQTAGLELYEQTLYLLWHDSREMTVEHVSSLALVSSALAGWNSLSQAWLLAGQACRAAQDIGLHRSPERLDISEEAKNRRRLVWWCVYGLDRSLSITLGRPMACNDADSDVEYPSGFAGSSKYRDDFGPPDHPSALTAFLELTRLYTLAGEVERSAHSVQAIRAYDQPDHRNVLKQTVQYLDSKMDNWVAEWPECIRSLESLPDRQGAFLLAMLSRITLFATTINLHRPLMPDNICTPHDMTALMKCVSAAKGCIRIGDKIKEIIPASHYCQFVVHYLTISAAILLRCTVWLTDYNLAMDMVGEAENCYHILLDLEPIWRGAEKSAFIVHKLLRLCHARLTQQSSRENTGHQSHKRSFEGDDMERDRSAKRSRQTPPVEGLPVPVFENKQTLWSRGKNNFDETDQIEHMSVRGTSQIGNGQPSLDDMRNSQLMPAAHLDEDISSLLEIVFNENERGYPVNYSLPLESTPLMDTMQDSDHQQLNIRRALFDTSFLYDLGRTT